jgi:DNA polymerase I-like protein with 3'-5' exonuclease and polymerase domains
MLNIAKRYKVAMTVHDSVVAVVKKTEIEEAKAFVMAAMRVRPSWGPGLPLNCEAGHGPTYGDC